MPAGRPTTFSAEIAEVICRRLAEGESLRSICLDDDMPHKSVVRLWKHANPEFMAQYARAREDQAEHWADEIVDIADDGSNDWVDRKLRDATVERVLDHEHVTRSRLRIDTRKWMLSKMKPGTYGDKVQHANAAGNGDLVINITKYADTQSAK